ncbi:MAG: IS110 family transposase, partial [Collinsella sp.]|nr:IS110 family transposase [Collinsella sp.]
FVYGGTTPAGNPRKYWTYDFLRWLDKVRPEDDGGVRTLAALRNEVEAAAEARADLLSEYRAAVDASPIAAEVAALQSIKGCAFALAAAFSAEVGDFTRFRSGRQVTAYFGLAPSQRSSGDSVRLGGISGAGNALVRKLAVEGSWCYAAARHQPKLMPRDTGVPLEIRMHGRKGSERLLRRREEMLARGMPAAKANAATAAELVRWLWALGMMCREGAE